MFRHRAYVTCSILVALAVTVVRPAAAAPYKVTEVFKKTIFECDENGYHTFRIPTIVRGLEGRLFAFVEGRKNSKSDSGNIDLVMKYSDDDGRTWSPMVLIKDAGKKTAGNPLPVVDSETGRVCLLYCINCNEVFSTYSDDNGKTWSKHKQISKDVLGPTIKRIYTGPVHGIQLTRGRCAGRLIVPGCYRSSLSWDCTYGACVFCSDDRGESWRIGAIDHHPGKDGVHPSENVAVELVDGRLLFNARNHFYNKELLDNPTRVIAHSSDGGESYDEPFTAYTGIITTVIQNSIVRFKAVDQGDGVNIIAYTAPRCPEERRTWRVDLTLYLSFDEGETWGNATLIQKGMSAYSDVVKIDGRHLGILYESGGKSGHYGAIEFCKVAVEKQPASTATCRPARRERRKSRIFRRLMRNMEN